MNSMFSCFDFYCIEVLTGKSLTQTARAYYTVADNARSPPPHDGATEKTIGKKSEENREFFEKTKTKNPQNRSAAEFDGLHYFETLDPY